MQMGLLSDPEAGGGRWARALVRWERVACAGAWLAALAWLLALALPSFNNGTYFSENALLPGLVRADFTDDRLARRIYTDYLEELEDKYSQRDDMPVPWLVGKMSQLHLEVYTHNFTLHYPLGRHQVYRGTNVYGVLRAARTSSLEALVVSVPYRPLSSPHKGTAAGLALMLAFAQQARPQKYWAKDIIFLVTEHEQLGMQAWLEAYHGLAASASASRDLAGSLAALGAAGAGREGHAPRRCLDAGSLPARSGAIQAAVNLEIHSPTVKYIEVKVEGLNGQLPNLDLVNLVNKMCVKSGLHHAYRNSYSWVSPRAERERWASGVRTLLGQVAAQLNGVPSGNHGLLHRFGIEAVTLEGREADETSAPRAASLSAANFRRLGAALEGTLRSLNNLLESFHQSYFFYLLAATDRFVSIGQYMPCLCLVCGALLVRALSLWITLQRSDDDADSDSDSASNSRESLSHSGSDEREPSAETGSDPASESLLRPDSEKQDLSEETGSERAHTPKDRSVNDASMKKSKEARKSEPEGGSVLGASANYLLLHAAGYVVMSSPPWLSYIGGAWWSLRTERAVYGGAAALCAAAAASAGAGAGAGGGATLAAALLELATLCTAVGMHNFPLGLALAALYAPLALLVSPTPAAAAAAAAPSRLRRFWHKCKMALCLALHPLSVVTLGFVAYSSYLFPEEPLLQAASRGLDAASQALLFSVVDSAIYGNWLFNVVCLFVLPVWSVFWQTLCAH